MRGFPQLAGVILAHCLDECNRSKLPRDQYIKKLQSMMDERGLKEDADEIVNTLLRD
jgi:hypothetical protein